MQCMTRRPSTCQCGGGYRVNGARWVRLEDGKLKCLACGWKWKSSRKYASRLPLHRERTRRGMTDQDILDRVADGSIVVDTLLAIAYSQQEGRLRRLRAVVRETKRGSAYAFVEVCSQGRKKKIAIHRLVWMAANRALVPPGYDVDHVLGRSHGDGIDNLRILPSAVNRSLGGHKAHANRKAAA